MTTRRKGTGASKAESGENPLIPHKKLRQVYTAMVEARLLESHITRHQRRLKAAQRVDSTLGQEACRVSTALELKAGDLVSEKTTTPVTRLILGADPSSLLRELVPARKGSRRQPAAKRAQAENLAQQLPSVNDARERLRIGMGAALALKSAKRGGIVVAYAGHRELRGSAWRKILTIAAKLELPIIFVVLPGTSGKSASDMVVCDKARSCGVPCIPVDSADAVALFRVAQESLGRTRGSDGPVVIECLAYNQRGKTTAQFDPLIQMGRFLLERKVCDQAWLNAAGKRLQARLKSLKH